MMGSIGLYSELLLHIKHVRVVVILPTGSREDTIVWLDDDRTQLSLVHDGQLASIHLPAALIRSPTLVIPVGITEEHSFRLPIDEDESLAIRRRSYSGTEYPWPASQLTGNTRVACANCKHDLVASTILSWKDLPSKHWAEMMDFWHCHKPDTPETSKNIVNGAKKGYSASNQIATAPGVGFVDLSYLLLSEGDCPGIQVCSFCLIEYSFHYLTKFLP